MNKYLLIVMILSISVFFIVSANATDTVDLQQLIKLSLQNDLQYEELMDQRAALDYTLEKDVDNLNPQYQLNYSHDQSEYLNSTTGRYEFGLGASYPIHDGGRRRIKIETDHTRQEILDLNIRIRQRDVSLSIYGDYINYLKNVKRKDVILKSMDNAEYYLGAAETNIKTGTGIKLDVLEAQAHLLTIQSDLVSANKNIELAKLALLHSANVSQEAFKISIEDPNRTPMQECSREAAIASYSHTPEYQLVTKTRDFAMQSARLSKSLTKPQYDVFGGYRFSGPDISLGDKAWQVGLNFTHDLGKNRTLTSSKSETRSVEDHVFPGGISPVSISQKQESLRLTFHDNSSSKPDVYSSAASARRADREIVDKQQAIQKAILEAWYNLRTNEALQKALENNVVTKEEALNFVCAEFDNGYAPTQDLVEADMNLLRAKMELIAATYDALLYEKQFLAAVGENPFPEFNLIAGSDDETRFFKVFLNEYASSVVNPDNNSKYIACLESLSAIKVAEEMYMIDNGTYTTNLDHLDIYMTATCTDPEGCNHTVKNGLASTCYDVKIIDDTSKDGYSLYIVGTAKDDQKCGICITPYTYRPESYEECADNKTAEERCE